MARISKYKCKRHKIAWDIKIKVFRFLPFLLLFTAACKKEIEPALPGDKPDMALNFYLASDVMRAANYAAVAVYIDKYQQPNIPNTALSYRNDFPVIYPNAITASYPEPSQYDLSGINYIRYVAGDHQIMLTDTTNTVVLDTTINQPAKSYTCLYFTDLTGVANQIAAYKMIAVQEARAGVPADQVGIRFIHLSPDAGQLTCGIRKADGSLANALPGNLAFGEASPYVYFSARDAISGLLRFSLDNPAANISIPAGVAFIPGRSYAILISGFFHDQQRRVGAGKNSDGSIIYKSINIGANLHIDIRETY